MRACRLRLLSAAVALALSSSVAPGATPGTAPGANSEAAETAATEDNFNDPLEEVNRAVFGFNQVVDEVVLVPVAKTYRTVLPAPVRQSVHDFLQNLNGPVIFANDILQGQFDLAVNTLGRVAINTTIGLGGLVDVAGQIGIPHHGNDLGITFATWGIADGPYIVMPVLGPSNPRDIAGKVGDGLMDPADRIAAQHHLLWASIARAGVSGIDVRSRNIESLADIEKTSLDFYATIRSLHRQRRAAEIRHEKPNLPNPSPTESGDGSLPAAPYFSANPPAYRELSAR